MESLWFKIAESLKPTPREAIRAYVVDDHQRPSLCQTCADLISRNHVIEPENRPADKSCWVCSYVDVSV